MIGPDKQSTHSYTFDGKKVVYDITYREYAKQGVGQISLASAEGFAQADLDTDEECYNCGDAEMEAKHRARATGAGIVGVFGGGDTNPYEIYELLTTQRGIQPSYRMEDPEKKK